MEHIDSNFKDLRHEISESLSARDKILRTAIILFNRDGIHITGVDRIIAEADVAKMTFYKHFPSKSDLVAAYLEFKDKVRTESLLSHTIRKTEDPAKQILGIFDSLEEWFNEPDFKGCPFVRGLYDFNGEKDLSANTIVKSHISRVNLFIEERLKKVVRNSKVPTLRDQIFSLIVGSAIIVLSGGEPTVAQTNKKLVETILHENRTTSKALKS